MHQIFNLVALYSAEQSQLTKKSLCKRKTDLLIDAVNIKRRYD